MNEAKQHNFIESKAHGSEYSVVIFCTQCGRVVWHFNKMDWSKDELQKDVGLACVGVIE